ncbi:MAG: SIR2 family protein, partial [Clostridia bacterium]|nr:SIR2 family protein [Clostridia bacterium]
MKVYPRVLLFGNGLYRCYGENSWNSFLSDLRRRNDLPDNLEYCLESPMTLRAKLIADGDIKAALDSAPGKYYGSLSNDLLRADLRLILSAGFDDIITTNYDYRLETAATDGERVTKYYLDKNARNTENGKKVEPKYLIHSYQNISFNGKSNRVWHIHGEAKKQDSMILSLYYYSNLLSRIIDYSKKKKNTYSELQSKGISPEIKSWIDAFILGDVYVLGFGFDYSEIDLWWLLERKKNETAEHGKVYY